MRHAAESCARFGTGQKVETYKTQAARCVNFGLAGCLDTQNISCSGLNSVSLKLIKSGSRRRQPQRNKPMTQESALMHAHQIEQASLLLRDQKVIARLA